MAADAAETAMATSGRDHIAARKHASGRWIHGRADAAPGNDGRADHDRGDAVTSRRAHAQ